MRLAAPSRLMTRRLIASSALLVAALSAPSPANAWEVLFHKDGATASCNLISRGSDGSSVFFSTVQDNDAVVVITVFRSDWSFTKDKLHPDIKIGTESGSFGPIEARGLGGGFMTFTSRNGLSDFVQQGAADGDNLYVLNGETVLTQHPLAGLRAKYAELIACDTARFRGAKSLPADPFKR